MKISTSPLLLLLAIALLSYSVQASGCPSIIADANSCSANVTISGSINITADFDPEAQITAIPCMSGVYCHEKYAQTVGKFCDLVDNEAGEACGTAGIYTVKEGTYPIPDAVQSIFGMITFRLLMGYEETCTGGKTAFPWLYGWSVLPVAGVAWYLRQRQRRRPLLVLDESSSPSQSFVEMKDVQRLGSMV